MVNPYVDYDKIVAQLYRMSAECRKAIDGKLEYIVLEDADFADKDTITHVYIGRLLKELGELGVWFTVSQAELFSNWHIGESVLNVLEQMLPETLYRTMSDVPESRYAVELLLRENQDPNDLITSYLEMLMSDPINHQCHDGAEYLLDKMDVSENFQVYLRSVIASSTKPPSTVLDGDLHRQYIVAMDQFKQRWMYASEGVPEDYVKTLNAKFNMILIGLSDEAIVEECVWFYASDPSELAPVEYGVWWKMYDKINKMLPVHRDHYRMTGDRSILTKPHTEALYMLAYIFALSRTKSDFIKMYGTISTFEILQNDPTSDICVFFKNIFASEPYRKLYTHCLEYYNG